MNRTCVAHDVLKMPRCSVFVVKNKNPNYKMIEMNDLVLFFFCLLSLFLILSNGADSELLEFSSSAVHRRHSRPITAALLRFQVLLLFD